MSKKLERIQKFERQIDPDQYFQKAQTEFRDYYNLNYPNLKAAEKALKNLVVLLLRNQGFHEPNVLSRLKDRNECIRKFDRKYRTEFESGGIEYQIKDRISDIIGVRVICIYESDIQKVSDVLCTELNMIEKTDKTKEMEEKEREFGYKGLHLDLILDEKRKSLPENILFVDQQFEVQIRTIVQDAWSEVDHKLKYKKEIPQELGRRIYRLAALFELRTKNLRLSKAFQIH